jgi:hypothetical protein
MTASTASIPVLHSAEVVPFTHKSCYPSAKGSRLPIHLYLGSSNDRQRGGGCRSSTTPTEREMAAAKTDRETMVALYVAFLFAGICRIIVFRSPDRLIDATGRSDD